MLRHFIEDNNRHGRDSGFELKTTRSTWALFAFAAILALAAFLRFYDNNASLFADEILTYKGASYPFEKVLTYKIYPFYYVLGNLALNFGRAEIFIRLPSILAGLALVALAYRVGRSLGGLWTGLLFALILAVLDYHVVQSRNARYYALLMLLYFGSLWYLGEALKRGGLGRWGAFAALAFLSFVTQVCAVPFTSTAIAGAAVYVLATGRGQLPAPKGRMMAALIVASLVACTGVGALMISLQQYPTQLISFSDEENGDEPATNKADPFDEIAPATVAAKAAHAKRPAERMYRLSLKAYAGYLNEFLLRAGTAPGRAERGRISPGFQLFGLALLIVGFVHLVYRHRPFAFVVAATLLLTPIPFLLIETSHFYHSRYFSPQVPLLALLMSMGITGAAAFTSHLLPRNATTATGPGEAPRMAAMGLTPRDFVYGIVCVVLFSPYAVALGMESHWRVTRGIDLYRGGEWKEAIPYMAQTMTPKDIVVQVVDGGPARGQMGQHMAFYYHRYLNNPWRYFNEQNRVTAVPEPGDITQLMENFPRSTIWVLSAYPEMLPEESIDELSRWNPAYRAFKRLRVWSVGEPTVNLFPMGDFEGEDAVEYFGVFDAERSFGLVGGTDVYDGGACLYIAQSNDDMVRTRVPLLPSFAPMRNARFDVWTDGGTPLGWNLVGPGVAGVSRTEGTRPESDAVSMDTSGGVIALEQRMPQWRPGMELTLGLWARVPDDRLRIVVEYKVDGVIQRREARHPGEDRWDVVELQVTLPLNATAGSALVRVRADERPDGAALVDDFQLSVGHVARALDPDKIYSLSFMARQAHIPEYEGRAMVIVSSTLPDGRTMNRAVHVFRGTADWHFVNAAIIPGRDTAENVTSLAIGFGLNRRGSRLWIDQLQFEESDHPTPFARGMRMPHDEVQ